MDHSYDNDDGATTRTASVPWQAPDNELPFHDVRSRTADSWSTVSQHTAYSVRSSDNSVGGAGPEGQRSPSISRKSSSSVAAAAVLPTTLPLHQQVDPSRMHTITEAPSPETTATAMKSFELDIPSSSSTHSKAASWVNRVRLFRKQRSSRSMAADALTYTRSGQASQPSASFHKSDEPSTMFQAMSQDDSRVSAAAAAQHARRATSPTTAKKPTKFQRFRSWLTSHNEEESVADFDEAEWTSPDSSYGAAIPVGGWIPKNIRRAIEASLIISMVIGLVYLIVTTSIRVSEDAKNIKNNTTSHSSAGGVELDDDNYIAYHDDYGAAYNGYNQDAAGDDGDQSAAVAAYDDQYVADNDEAAAAAGDDNGDGGSNDDDDGGAANNDNSNQYGYNRNQYSRYSNGGYYSNGNYYSYTNNANAVASNDDYYGARFRRRYMRTPAQFTAHQWRRQHKR